MVMLTAEDTLRELYLLQDFIFQYSFLSLGFTTDIPSIEHFTEQLDLPLLSYGRIHNISQVRATGESFFITMLGIPKGQGILYTLSNPEFLSHPELDFEDLIEYIKVKSSEQRKSYWVNKDQ